MDKRWWIAILGLGIGGAAMSQTGDAPAPADVRLRCKSFPTDVGQEIDTRDQSLPVGTWVMGLEDQGWRVHSVTWQIGQKPTGFQQGYTHVCLEPIRTRTVPKG